MNTEFNLSEKIEDMESIDAICAEDVKEFIRLLKKILKENWGYNLEGDYYALMNTIDKLAGEKLI